MAVLVATDFFTVEVLTLRGLITYYVLFFIDLESRRVCLAGVTSSESRVDGTDGAQCDDGRFWFSDQQQVPTA